MLLTIGFTLPVIRSKAFTSFCPKEKAKDYVSFDPPSASKNITFSQNLDVIECYGLIIFT